MKVTENSSGKAMTLSELKNFVQRAEKNEMPGDAVLTIRVNLRPHGTLREITADSNRTSQ